MITCQGEPMSILRQRHLKLFSAMFLAAASLCLPARAEDVSAAKQIEALMITGGGYHDYLHQKDVLTQGISARANVHWTVFFENGETEHELSIYSNPDFAKGFDVILHNECYAGVADPAFVSKALAPHVAGIPAVVLHASLHTFRSMKTDEWREFIGMTSHGHCGGQLLKIKPLQPQNPIMVGFPAEWAEPQNDELYIIEKVWPNAQPIAQGDTQKEQASHPVIWSNLYQGKTRVFGTTLGHETKTMAEPVYLDFLARGLLWACDKLDDKGQPKPGYGPQPSPPPPTILSSETNYSTGKPLDPHPSPQFPTAK